MLPQNLNNQLTQQTRPEKKDRNLYPYNNKDLPYDVSKYSITLDTLITILTINSDSYLNQLDREFIKDVHSVSDRLQLKRDYQNEKNFNCFYYIYLDKKKVAGLSTESKVKGKPDIVKLKIENRLLYTSTWYNIYQTILKELSLSFNNVSYLEIAYDSYHLAKPYKRLWRKSTLLEDTDIEDLEPAIYKPINKVEILPAKSDYTSFNIGLKKAGKQITIYNKSLEIKENDKDYISDFHHLNGLDTTKQIDRVELKLSSKYLQKYKHIEVIQLLDKSFLQSTFKQFTEDSLSFYDLRTKYYSNRNVKYQIVKLIDYSNFNTDEIKKKDKLDSIAKPERKIKSTFKTVAKQYHNTGNAYHLQYLVNYLESPENSLAKDGNNNGYYYGMILKNLVADLDEDSLNIERIENLYQLLGFKTPNYQESKNYSDYVPDTDLPF